MKQDVTWKAYRAKRDEIWALFNADKTLTHEERGQKIKEALDQLNIV